MTSIVCAFVFLSTAPVTSKPAIPHPVATECQVTDAACVASHDDRALTLALVTGDKVACMEAVRPLACVAAYRMIVGDVELAQRSPMLSDPCTFVVRIDRGVAQLYSARTQESRRANAQRGWKTGEFIGECRLSELTSDVTAEALPRFPWQ